MKFEIYGRVCVGAPLRPDAAVAVHDEFLASLGLTADGPSDEVFAVLRDQAPKHKRHEPDRVRYERALEEFIDAKWDVDFAVGGLAPNGVLELKRGFLFVGVRVEQFEMGAATLPTGANAADRPQWLRKGDLSPGSDLVKALGADARKPFEHAGRTYSRAGREVLNDTIKRLRPLPVSTQHEPDWALVRWVVEADHPSVQTRHGRER